MWMMILFSFFSRAASEDIMQVKSLPELQKILHKSEEKKTFYSRCQAELRGPYLPSYCYVWLQQSGLSDGEKKILLGTLDDLCVHRLDAGIAIGEKSLKNSRYFSARCQKSLKEWLQVHLYKLHRQDSAALFQKIKTGNVFESTLDHGNTTSVFENRIPTPRAARRRLN